MKLLLNLAIVAVALALPAQAAPYTLFIYESPGQLALRPGSDDASAAYWAAYDTYGKDLAAAGVLRGGSALTTGTTIALVTSTGAEPAPVPYAKSEMDLGGYFQIDVASDAEAIAWAQKLPFAQGLVEVRAGYPVPGMKM